MVLCSVLSWPTALGVKYLLVCSAFVGPRGVGVTREYYRIHLGQGAVVYTAGNSNSPRPLMTTTWAYFGKGLLPPFHR